MEREIFYSVYKCPQPIPILNQMNSIYTQTRFS
jgi:hypothetical protein